MGHLDHAAFGLLTPVLSYAMAVIGAALGLRCTVRALDASGRSRRNWLITAASAIGTGIWTMHFVAMLGFAVRGTDIRYNVPLTILSLLVAMLVVGAGVFCVGFGRDRVTRAAGRRAHHRARRGQHALPGHGRPAAARLGALRPAARRALRRHRRGRRDRGPVGGAQHQVAGRGRRRLARHGRGGQQHALHRNARGQRAGRALRRRTARGHGDAVHLPPRRRPRVVPLRHLGVRRALPDGTRARRLHLGRAADRQPPCRRAAGRAATADPRARTGTAPPLPPPSRPACRTPAP